MYYNRQYGWRPQRNRRTSCGCTLVILAILAGLVIYFYFFNGK